MPKKENREIIEILNRLSNVENNVELLKELVKLQNNYINNSLTIKNKDKDNEKEINMCENLEIKEEINKHKNENNKLREDKFLRRRTII